MIKKTVKKRTSSKKKTKNGYILDNDNIDITKFKYPVEDAIKTVQYRMGVYGFNVDLERAFPQVRDGLKPVQRKIIYTGIDSGFLNSKPYKKSLRFIGDGSKYYVHGNASFYSSMMTMSQDWYTKYPTIEVHGNNGAISGDSYAAERYTESKLSKYVEDLVSDLSPESIDWQENFDSTELEPTVLPVKYPNLLLNGTYGIGQGYVSSIPSHNFGDIVDRTIKLIKNPDISIDELVKDLVPDYPTGGIIINKKDLPNMYKTGQGTIRIRGKIITDEKGNLIIKSIPYMKNTGSILDSIQSAVKDGKINGISSIEDSTNENNGINIKVVIKKGYDSRTVESQLYKFTLVQDSTTFQLICVAPDALHFKYYNFKEMLEEWVKFRKVTLIRKFNSDISRLNKKIHINEGLLIALDKKNIEKIISLMRTSSTYAEIKDRLISEYGMTDIQSEYISQLKLRQLSAMGVVEIKSLTEKLKQELEEIINLLKDPECLNDWIIKELEEGRKKYDSPRKTESKDVDLNNLIEETIENTKHVVFVTNEGFIKKIDASKIKVQNVNGQGINTGKVKDADYNISTFYADNLDEIFLFTNKGRMFSIKTYEVKDSNLTSYGILLETLIKLKEGEKVVKCFSAKKEEFTNSDAFLLFATKNGLIKKSKLSLYSSVPKSGFCAIDLNTDDEIVSVVSAKYDMDIIVATNLGSIIRYNTDTVSSTKRMTKGVKSIILDENEKVVSMDIFSEVNNDLVVVTNKGNGKRINMKTLSSTDRTKKTKPLTKLVTNEKVVSSFFVSEKDEITIVGSKKIIKIPANQIEILMKSNPCKKIVNLGRAEKILFAIR